MGVRLGDASNVKNPCWSASVAGDVSTAGWGMHRYCTVPDDYRHCAVGVNQLLEKIPGQRLDSLFFNNKKFASMFYSYHITQTEVVIPRVYALVPDQRHTERRISTARG